MVMIAMTILSWERRGCSAPCHLGGLPLWLAREVIPYTRSALREPPEGRQRNEPNGLPRGGPVGLLRRRARGLPGRTEWSAVLRGVA